MKDGERAEIPAELAAEPDLPRQPGAIRGLMRRNPRWVDGFIAAIYVLATAGFAVIGAVIPEEFEDAGTTFEYTHPEYLRFPQILLLVLIVAVTVTALFMRRRYPLLSLVAPLVALIPGPGDMVPLAATIIPIAVLLYSIPVYRSVAAGWVGYGIAVVASLLPIPFMGDVITAEVNKAGEAISLVVTSSLLLLIPLVFGINAGNRRRYTDAIIDRAHQLARERDQRARLAVVEERTRIAREMHDIVAHSVSVMVTLSEGAAHVVDAAPEDARKAIQQSAETGRSALAEMRRLIGVLRDGDDAEYAPTPGVEALPELIQGFRAAGLTVHLTYKGADGGALEGEDHGRALAIHRTIQEALTNALRYAGRGATVNVVIEQRPDLTAVTIEDDGGIPGEGTAMNGLGSGHGLMGLAERLRMLGGELEYGPNGAGGWRVTVTLPTGEGRRDD